MIRFPLIIPWILPVEMMNDQVFCCPTKLTFIPIPFEDPFTVVPEAVPPKLESGRITIDYIVAFLAEIQGLQGLDLLAMAAAFFLFHSPSPFEESTILLKIMRESLLRMPTGGPFLEIESLFLKEFDTGLCRLRVV